MTARGRRAPQVGAILADMEARQVDAADLSRIAHLLIACRSGELGDHGTLWLLRRSLSSGLERQTHLWEDDAGSVVACAMLVGTHLEFYVHPDAQGSQVETQVMAWPGECVREQGMPILVSARASANDTARIALLEHYGFTRQAHRMLR